MNGWPSHLVVYEVDTWPWLAELREFLGPAATLGNLPARVWDELAPAGADAVWLVGVWERSPAGLALAGQDAALQGTCRPALPDVAPVGSPYGVRRYLADARLGGPAALAAARAQLARRGLRLILDHVPDHVALDHPAVRSHPDCFVRGTARDRAAAPEAWFDLDGRVLAHGRDPLGPPWPDVAQLDAFRTDVRRATARVLDDILDQCDGVRCERAMLMTNDVFGKTWGAHAGTAPAEEFWPVVIEALRRRHPDAVLIADAYRDMQWTLRQQGFDFCYDKRLYDRLLSADADGVRTHLSAGYDYQRRLVHSIEDYDEPRAAAALPGRRHRAAAIAVATLPGATLWHDGQFEGRRVRLPGFLGRRPAEPVDLDRRQFYRRLVAMSARLRRGNWTVLDVGAGQGGPAHRDVVAWGWYDGQPHHVIAVNLGGHPSRGRILLPWNTLRGRHWQLSDLIDGHVRDEDGDELAGPGLAVDLPPWAACVFALQPR